MEMIDVSCLCQQRISKKDEGPVVVVVVYQWYRCMMSICFGLYSQVNKRIGRMPWQLEAMKDV